MKLSTRWCQAIVALMGDRAVILLAEDQKDDVFLIRRAFVRAHIFNPIHVVPDGEEAVAYLEGEGKYSNRAEYPLPDLLLLDLKLPRMDGFEVLQWLKMHPSLASLRVLVLTASNDLRDVNRAYKLGANSFLVKPFDFENFIELGKLIGNFWLRVSKAPEISRPDPKPQDQTAREGPWTPPG